jgi:hypothetical protein
MDSGSRHRWPARTVGGVGLAGIVLVGLLVRLAEPLSSPVLPAEDPFTHMVRLKAHLHEGGFQAQTPIGDLYPPGMHAMLAAGWAFTGGDLYPLFRFAPVVFGAIGLLGIGLLLWHRVGIVAALAGALAAALAPELVFRTTMMAPTAVDLAVLPFVFYALLEILAGRLAWTGVAAVLVGFLVFAHPWVLGVLAAAGLVFALLAVAQPWPVVDVPRLSSRGFATAMAVLGVGFGLVLSTCGGFCGPGFGEVVGFGGLQLVAPLVLVLALLPGAFLLVQDRALESLPANPYRARSRARQIGLGLLVALAAAGVVAAGWARGLPEFVAPPRMLGWPLLVLAGAGLLAVPFLAGPLAYLAAGLTLGTLPLAVFDLFGGFVAHRAVVYLGLGLVLLAGVLAGGLTRAIRDRLADACESRRPRRALALVPALLVAGAFGATVAAGTPEPYEDGWYHLYEPCELDALREVGDRIGEHPATLAITGDWPPGTVLQAVASAEPRIWYHESFFADPGERATHVDALARSPGTLYVVEDRHLRHEQDRERRAFLDEEGWRVTGTWCEEELGPRNAVRLHVHGRTM